MKAMVIQLYWSARKQSMFVTFLEWVSKIKAHFTSTPKVYTFKREYIDTYFEVVQCAQEKVLLKDVTPKTPKKKSRWFYKENFEKHHFENGAFLTVGGFKGKELKLLSILPTQHKKPWESFVQIDPKKVNIT